MCCVKEWKVGWEKSLPALGNVTPPDNGTADHLAAQADAYELSKRFFIEGCDYKLSYHAAYPFLTYINLYLLHYEHP